ncbi:Uncharacterised protein [Edwardsiella hoshinae]|uniref:DUF4186 domain-containing protein n=1 Tax=Edwardsiella hoshinae TaxID=93378 RepID=A0A376DCZ6_9GAMM|nr:DUF4186 domain-containing protein [Edwardsiella hoshinae]STC86184.1 Uncharacterised protein [Edwardsiella hoshinae]
MLPFSTAVWQRLQRSTFRRRFRLGSAEWHYLEHQGMAQILRHAHDFIETRLAPPLPPNDGRQTPMRGHPVFIAQHATATCCRGCLAKWHHIPADRALSGGEKLYILALLAYWLSVQQPVAP